MNRHLSIFALLLVAVTANAQSCPDDNHPHAIDLGLPSGTKWACCNVGATAPTENGGYYAWGETEEKDIYDFDHYLWGNYDYYGSQTFTNIGEDICASTLDVAQVKWSGQWCLPNVSQAKELYDYCSLELATVNNVQGLVFTGDNGMKVFMPANGYINEYGEVKGAGQSGFYWTGMISSWQEVAQNLRIFPATGRAAISKAYRFWGEGVRPVAQSTDNILSFLSSDSSCQAIYNICGIKVADNVEQASTLSPGIYIINGKKFVIK